MAGVTDLTVLLRAMEPQLFPEIYGFAVVRGIAFAAPAFARIAEDEGETVVAEAAALAASGVEPGAPWARISLTVHSDLAAVGLTAAFATALAAKGISANVIAGFHHDHIFVQWERRHDALAALKELSHA